MTISEVLGILFLSAPFLLLIYQQERSYRRKPNKSAVGEGFKSDGKSDLSSGAKSQLIKNIDSIGRALSSKHGHFKEAPFSLQASDSDNIDAIQEQIYQLCEHCQLRGISVGATFVHEDNVELLGFHGKNPAGHVVRFGKNRYSIWINPKFVGMGQVIGAILAHEIAHIFAMEKNLQFKAAKNNGDNHKASEQMTDLLAIALGMGKISLQGCSYYRAQGQVQEVGTVGYLTPEMMHFAYDHWQKNRSSTIYL